MDYTFIPARKHDKFAHEGYLYRFDRENADGTTSWRCDQRIEGKNCKGRVRTDEIGGVRMITDHACVLKPARVQVAAAVADARERAVATQEPARRIIAEATLGLSEAAKAQFPRFETLQRKLNRDRRRARAPYPVPQNLAQIDIPQQLRNTIMGDAFLYHDSGANDPERFLMFATERNIETLQNSPIWCVDGTFKIVPALYHQLWTVHSIVNNQTLPLVYVLMARKTQALYDRVLDALTNGHNLQPDMVILDFELATMNSLRAHFPQTTIHGCFFHLSQSIWRKVQANGLQHRYVNDADFQLHVKMIVSLAFVALQDVEDSFDLLAATFDDDADLAGLLDYFETTYVRGQRRRLAQFPPDVWNCHEVTANGLPRTNNNVEGWHQAFQGMINCSHPNIYRLLENLQTEQSLMETRRARLDAGEQIPLFSKNMYRQINQRLQALIDDYDNRGRMDFLRGCSHNFDF